MNQVLLYNSFQARRYFKDLNYKDDVIKEKTERACFFKLWNNSSFQ